MKRKIFYILFIALSFVTSVNAQVGIGTTAPNSSAMLDVVSSGKGFLPPRMSTINRIAISSPAVGLIVFDTDINCLYVKLISGWSSLCSGDFRDSMVITHSRIDSLIVQYARIDSLIVTYAQIDSVIVTHARIDSLIVNYAQMDSVFANFAQIDSLIATYAHIDSLIATYAHIDSLIANYARIDSLFANYAHIDSLIANYARIDSLFANYANIDSLIANYARIDSLFANYAYIDSLFANYARIDSLFANYAYIDSLFANFAQIDSLFANFAQIDSLFATFGSFDSLYLHGQNIDSLYWSMKGNTGTNANINFLGTKDNVPLILRSNNLERMRIASAGNIEIANQLKISGGLPGSGKVLVSDATGLASWVVPIDNNTTYTAGTGLSLIGTTFANTGDLSSTNELQNLAYTAGTRVLDISNGTGVTLPLFATTGTNAGLIPGSNSVGATYFLNGNGGWSVPTDANTTYTAGTGLSLTGTTFSHNAHTGDATGSDALSVVRLQGNAIAVTAPTTGQVLTWNGTAWTPTTIVPSGTFSITTKTGDYTATGTDYTILCNNTATATITLPSTAETGKTYVIKSISTGQVDVIPNGGRKLDGISVAKSLKTQYYSYTVQYDGTDWWIIEAKLYNN